MLITSRSAKCMARKPHLLPAVRRIQHDRSVEPGSAIATADHEEVPPDGCRCAIAARRRHRGAIIPAAHVRRQDVDQVQPLMPIVAAQEV